MTADLPAALRPQGGPNGHWLRGLRRPLLTGATVGVWLLAVGGAVYLHQKLGKTGTIMGFADDRPVMLTHLEAGIVRGVHVQLHESVACGQVVISMDDREERIQLAKIQKDIERLRAEVDAVQTQLAAENARAQADVDDQMRQFAVDREDARVEYLSLLVLDAYDRVLLRGKMVEYEITRNLYAQGSAAVLELNQIQTDVEALQANIAQRAEALAQLKDAFQAADRRWARFAARAEVVTAFEPVLTPLRLAIDVRERDLEETVCRIDSHVLRAPIDGQVTALLAHAGTQVQAGVALATISPVATSRVVAYIPEPMVLSVPPGAPVTVRCVAGDGRGQREYAGTIGTLSATVTEAPLRYRRLPTYPVWGREAVINLDDDVRLIPGEACVISTSVW
ncbi:MAG: HlyD family efflux transporter periplasmic adaptor subunit [Phycisphaerae bacterium]|nr:HlyD family efflux transporter periplasmic adaptor subunit [Phycisphaerae bacterium]